MKSHTPKIFADTNLSVAWARAFLNSFDNNDDGCFVLSVRNFTTELPPEDIGIRGSVDAFLQKHRDEIPSINQTALTIFPYERWKRMNKPDLKTIKEWYLVEFLPRLKARCSKNRHGTYFERIVSYSGVKNTNGHPEHRVVNQLEHVIDLWRKGAEKGKRPRQSALQLCCFDPAKDHTGSALAGFPCLQQISLTYKESGTLELNAYYPTQYLLERAYGNYLGLCQLGHFLAHQLQLRFTTFNCFVANPEFGNMSRSEAAHLARGLRVRIGKLESSLSK